MAPHSTRCTAQDCTQAAGEVCTVRQLPTEVKYAPSGTEGAEVGGRNEQTSLLATRTDSHNCEDFAPRLDKRRQGLAFSHFLWRKQQGARTLSESQVPTEATIYHIDLIASPSRMEPVFITHP